MVQVFEGGPGELGPRFGDRTPVDGFGVRPRGAQARVVRRLLAIGSVGLVRALGVTVEAALGPAAIGGIAYQDEIARMLPYAVVGLPTWLVAWALVLRDGAGDRLGFARRLLQGVEPCP